MAQPTRLELMSDGETTVASVVYADGERVGRYPGDDISDLPADMQAQINAAWTPQVVAAYQLGQAQAKSSAAIDQQMFLVRAAGHTFTTGPLAGKTVTVPEGTEAALNFLTLFTDAKDECDLGHGADVYPGPLLAVDGPVNGLTWQQVLDAMRELRQWGIAVLRNAVTLKMVVAMSQNAFAAQSVDPTFGWPT